MLDTASCTAILTRTDESLIRRLEGVAVGDICISAVTLSELMFGAVMSRRTEQEQAALDVFLRHVAVVDYPGSAAEHYAAVREALYWKDGMIGAHELLVAAHARSLGATLVTGKTRELRLVPGFSSEKWGK